MKSVHESDRFLFPSTFQESSIRFSCAISRSGMSWLDEINVTQWNRIWFFFLHVQLNFWVHFPSFCVSSKIPVDSFVIFCFFRLKDSLSPWDSPLRFSLLTVVSRLRVGSWNSWSLPDNFAETPATRNTNSSYLWVIRTSFAFSLLK